MTFSDDLDLLESVSPVMRDALRSHPEWLDWLRANHADAAPGAEPAGISGADTLAALRLWRQREYLRLAFRDVSGIAPFEETVAGITALADRSIAAALRACRDDAPEDGFAVIAFGKLGGSELNYSSDVDLLFVRRTSDDDAEARQFTRVGERLVRALGLAGPGGFLYRVDMRLRPYGNSGPLVPTIDSLENYYESWAEAWERQALIKARPVCGDAGLCARFERFASKFTFARQMDDSSLEEIKRVKHRAEKEYASPPGRIHIKQGPGGIRDIEFYTQYLQLVAGSRNPAVRVRPTLDAILRLGEARALLEGEESLLSVAYVFLRTVEHRLQLRALTPQAQIPESRDEVELLAAGLGFGRAGAAADAFLTVLNDYRARVRSILERIYLTPGALRPRERQEEFAQLLSERAPRDRVRELLAQYGFRDVDKAWQNIRLMALGPAGHQLPPGERRAFLEIVFPMLEVLRDSFDPDLALHNLESFAAASGNRVSFLRSLASRRPHLARLSNLLALSNLCHQVLARHPEYFDSLARGIHLHEGRGAQEMQAELGERLRSAPAGEEQNLLRRYRQREMVRIAYRDLAELGRPLAISRELSELAEACLHAAAALEPAGDHDNLAGPLHVVALGKLGSRQMHYSSDLDLLFLYQDPPEGATPETRTRVQLLQDERVERLLERLAGITREGAAYKVDLRLRPEGATGLLARSWSSFLEYARRHMQPWERMALTRSRILACDPEIEERWAAALSEHVYGYNWDAAAIEAVRHLKRRIETESSRESRICLDFKLGKGGIADLEFMVQLLQVRHGKGHPAARVPDIAGAIAALREAGILTAEDAGRLAAAHLFQRRVENHYQMIEEWTSREISREAPLLERLARSLGYHGGDARKAFVNDWESTAKAVRGLVEKLFYGGE